jgi:hypothetical protein
MDETDVQTMLQRLADTPAPPARIDLGRAVSEGRRGKRLRQTKIGGSVLAAGAAAGVVVALLAVPGPRAAGLPSAASTGLAHAPVVMPATAPTRFNPLVPYASFGWMPSGYAVGGANVPDATSTTRDVQLIAGQGTAAIDLDVHAKGACWQSGPASRPAFTCSNPLGGSGPVPAVGQAPDVNGRPAFWAANYGGGGSLVWEYAPGAWATLEVLSGKQGPPTAGERPMLSRVAETVRYGQSRPLAFPFWLTGIPADWAVTVASFTEPSPGLLAGATLNLGPKADPLALALDIQPTTRGGACKFIAGQSSYVTLDGARAVLRVLTGPGDAWESVCTADAHGYLIDNGLDIDDPNTSTPVSGEARLGGVLGISRHIHLLDPDDPATWTADPLR